MFSWGNRQRKDFYLVVMFECSLGPALYDHVIYLRCLLSNK